MLKPNAHHATPVRVLGTVGPDGVSVAAEGSARVEGAMSGDCDPANGPLSGGDGTPVVWLTPAFIARS
jgi:hypothetical protein